MHGPRWSCSRALCKPCNAGCISEVLHGSLSKKKVPTSFWHGHLVFWVGGRGSTKDFAFLVAPSFHLSLAVRLQAGLLATKVQNTSRDLHALGAFGRRVTCSPCKGCPFNCTQRKRGDFCNRSAKKPRQALTWWAKASSWDLLTWISVSPC